jgi:hypothetical protein
MFHKEIQVDLKIYLSFVEKGLAEEGRDVMIGIRYTRRLKGGQTLSP